MTTRHALLLATAVLATALFASSAYAYNFSSNATHNIYRFTYNETFTINTTTTAAQGGQFLIVAGGGGGGGGWNTGGAGGGAGGYFLNRSANFTAGTYSIVVGYGGAAGLYTVSNGSNGGSSSFAGFTMTGGGGGAIGKSPSMAGLSGGSGGGSAYNGAAGTATAGQGYNGGGSAATGNLGTGGGGGAGSVGANGDATNGGNGGSGNTTTINGTSVCYAGGGGGATDSRTGTAGTATCGGGNAATGTVSGGNATDGTGGGGGGGSNAVPREAGKGGSGVVIISLPLAAPTPNFVITANNNYTGTAINAFRANVTINGTLANYGTTNGTINFNFTSGSVLVNVSANTSGLFFSASTTNWNTSANYTASFVPWANITARDRYDGSTLAAFAVTYNGTNYTTTNGYTQIPALGTYNAETYANNYFSTTLTNAAANATQNASLFQAMVTFNATEIITQTNVTAFTVSNNSLLNSNGTATIAPVLYLKAGNYNLTFNKSGWYSTTYPVTVAALQNNTQNLSNVYRYLLNISFASAVNSTRDTTFTATVTTTNYSTSSVVATTNGTAYVPWWNETNFNISVNNASFLAQASQWYNLSNYTYAPVLANVTVLSYTTNTFSFTFYNETSDLVLGTNVTISLISDTYSANFTTSNTSNINISLLIPTDYEIQYYYDNRVIRSYYVTLANQSYNAIRLYTIDYSTRSLYVPAAVDQYSYPCASQTISLLRYFVNANAYSVVEMTKTDTNGEGVLNVQPNIINYKLQFSGTCGDFTTDPQKMTASTNTFTVTNAQSPLTAVAGAAGVTNSLSYVNATQTIVYTWADTTNFVTQGCLVIEKLAYGVRSTVSNTCNAASSGSLLYTVTDTNHTTYYATGTVTVTTGNQYSTFLTASYENDYSTFGVNGLFITLLVVILFATFGLGSVETTVLFGVLGIVLMGVFGFIAWSWSYFVGIAIILGIIMYKVNR